ncbi:MAG: glycoside hydrolase family 31 protein [Deltaproteobacteria bacterium]|nr:glycoside hydrolase family 31 protein [Deltaproteobacteria bacterium]
MRSYAPLTMALVCALAGACGKDDEAPAPVIELADGAVRARIETRPFRVTIFEGTREVLATLPDLGPAATFDEPSNIARGIPGWDGYEAVEDPWARSAEASIVSRGDKSAKLRFAAPGGSIELDVELKGALVRFRQRAAGKSNGDAKRPWNKSTIGFAWRGDEHAFGLGERYASVDHRGLSMYSWAEEAGLGSGEAGTQGPSGLLPSGPSMTYFPVPFFLSSKGYGLHVDTTYRVETHFGSERADALRVAVNATSIDLAIYVQQDPLATLDAFTAATGRPIVPSPWVFGPRRRVGRGSMVGTVPEWKAIRDAKIPTTALDDAVHFLPARSELGIEAELKTWTETLHANGYKAIGYYNPYVGKNRPVPATDFEYGRSKGLFIKAPGGEPGITGFVSGTMLDVGTIDLTNPAAVAWFHDMLRRSVALGYDGWMHDFGEYVHRSWTAFDGRKGDELHNAFPVLSAKAAHDFWQKERPNDYLYFVRSGWTGTQAYTPAVWGGDPEATFDDQQGLPASVRGGINLGLTGVPYFGSDISGFKCFDKAPRDKEVFFRWSQFGAVSPIMMDQNACYAIPERGTKWHLWSDAESTELYAKMSRLHTRLQPYFLVLARQARERGTPLMRHPFLLHPTEPAAWAIDDAFFLGSALYAAPVVRRGQREKKTWLAPGRRYVDLDDLRVYASGPATIPAPLAKLPLLLVEREILPLLDPTIDTLAPATEPSVVTLEKVADRLDVLVALAKGGKAQLTLVDGTELVAERTTDDAGNPGSLSTAPDEAGLAACYGCFLESKTGDVDRTRVTTQLAATTTVTFKDLRLSAKGPSARRIRWDVYGLR